jgi:hypothetical protein
VISKGDSIVWKETNESEPDMQIARIRLSDKTSRLRTRQVTTKDPVDEQDRSARRGARMDSSRPCDA